ncbi:EthD domain-containing protein [Sphingomonas crocodyli]|uniref:EthD family reductase n=1 Tax=Sphingomonas crocodyli TaxID=1979270 RepID=A0A437LUI4_9SPHN|nr:EthD domain-containing protein [Sphingomonas crocodyli]RVT89091.1 EthD family reductase [Sphingomonas crocodyli]
MYKIVCLIRRLPGVTPEAFRAHYEGVHAPLALSIMPALRSRVRRYVRRFPDPLAGQVDFDVMMEMWFDDKASHEAALADLSNPDVAARIAADEAHFLDRATMRVFAVEECDSLLP